MHEVLYPALQHHLGHNVPLPKGLGEIEGLNAIDKVIVIDQSPIGRTPARTLPPTLGCLMLSVKSLVKP